MTNIWFDFAPMLLASKSRSYKESVTKKCTSLVGFLYDKSVLKSNPLNEIGEIQKDLQIQKDDLTEAGQYLFTSGAIYKWFEYTDKSGNTDNFKRLEKVLAEYSKD